MRAFYHKTRDQFNPWDWFAAQKGTIYFSDLQLLTACVTGSDGVLQGIKGEVQLGGGITNWSLDRLTISNAEWVGFTQLTLALANGLTLETNSALALHGGTLHCLGYLVVTNGGELYAFSSPTNDLSPDYGMLVNVAGSMRIASNSWVYSGSDGTNGGSPLFRVKDLTIADGGGGGRIAVWIGVPENIRVDYLAGTLGRVITNSVPPTNTYAGAVLYLGSVSVTHGTGSYSVPPNGAASGTQFFFTVPVGQGTVFTIF